MAWKEEGPATSQAFTSPALPGPPELPRRGAIDSGMSQCMDRPGTGRQDRGYPVQKVGPKYPPFVFVPQHREVVPPSASIAAPTARLAGGSKAMVLAVRLHFCEPEKGCHGRCRSSRLWLVLLGKVFSWAHELAESLKGQLSL